MESVRSFLNRLSEPFAKELRVEAIAYDPTSYYPIDAKEVSPEVVAALNDARRRKVDIASDYIVDAKEQEKIHALMRKHGLVQEKFERKYANFPSVGQMLDQSPEPFQYHFTYPERLWFITINPVPIVKMYDPTKWYRIDAIQMSREVVAVIESVVKSTGGERLADAKRNARDCLSEAIGVSVPTLASEREKIHAAMRDYGLVKKEYQKWHCNMPPLEQIINQNKEEPFAYHVDAGRLWFMEINPVRKKQ